MPENNKKIEDLLKENLEISQSIHKMTKRTRRWIVLQQVWFGLQILVLVAIIVSALIYVPPFIQKMSSVYGGLMKSSPGNFIEGLIKEKGSLNLENLSDQEIQDLIQEYR